MSYQQYKVSSKQLLSNLFISHEAGLVPFVHGSPGCGKSATIKAYAKSRNLKVIDIRLSTLEPTDLSGLPTVTPEGIVTHKPFDLIPLEGIDEVPEGYDGWLVFLDEYNHCMPAMQRASYKVILDRQIGKYDIHSKVLMVAAGNLDTDGAMTETMSTAALSRFHHFFMKSKLDDWIENVAIPFGYSEKVIAYLSNYRNDFYDFNPELEDAKSFCSNRSWEGASRLMRALESNNVNISSRQIPLFAGILSPGTAVRFVSFVEMYKDVVTVEQVMADPNTAKLPESSAMMWATTTALVSNTNKDNLDPVLTYIQRLPETFQTVYIRMAAKTVPELRQHKIYYKMVVNAGKLLS